MSHRAASASFAFFAAFAPLAAPAQTATAYVPDANAAGGVAQNSIPFNPNFGAAPGSFTQLLIVPAAQLQAQGAVAGSELLDVGLAPAGSGTLSFANFKAAVGHVPTPFPAPALLGALASTATLYDSDASGPFTWLVVGDQWNSLGLGGGGFQWDGASDVGVFTTHQGLQLTSAGWPGTFWRGGTTTRLYSPGYQAAAASVVSASSLKVSMTFATGPAAYAYSTTYGAPVGGTFGHPFVFTSGEPSFTNDSFAVAMTNALPGTQAVLAWSAAAANWNVGVGGLDAPILIDLSPSGAPQFAETTTDANGAAGFAFTMPAFDPALVGLHVYAQWFVLGDPNGRPTLFGFPLVATAGLDLRVGV